MTDSTSPSCFKCGRPTNKPRTCSTCLLAAKPLEECGGCGKARRLLAKGLCPTCYSYHYRKHNPVVGQCGVCGTTYEGRKGQQLCSLACQQLDRAQKAKASPRWADYQAKVQAEKRGPKPYEPVPEDIAAANREAARIKRRGPLLAAYEDGDNQALIQAVRAKSLVTESGCWDWQGRKKSRYGQIEINGRHFQVHRLTLEARIGKPLGSQHAHHICANPSCVNPDHLQPATHAENMAEMKARQSYVARIRELESALQAIAPEHEVLNRAAYA